MTDTPINKKGLAFALKKPRITEKASLLASQNIYTFDVPKGFNKAEIAMAVKTLYKVTPLSVRVIAVPSKSTMNRGRPGVKSGGKKALVYLKKGDKIEFV